MSALGCKAIGVLVAMGIPYCGIGCTGDGGCNNRGGGCTRIGGCEHLSMVVWSGYDNVRDKVKTGQHFGSESELAF